jgi:ribosomal protein S27E
VTTMDVFTIVLGLLIGGIAFAIVQAIRVTRRQIDERLQTLDPEHVDERTRQLVAQVREQSDRIKCAHCGGTTAMVLRTSSQYKCDACDAVFDGPPHLP